MYIEAKEVAKRFREDLQKLLNEYNAVIEIEENPYAYGEERIMVYIPSKFTQDGECLAEYTIIDLGRNFGD